MQTYLSNLKNISHNLILVYKNFFHWNISKICVFLYANIVGFVLSLPFIGGILYQYFTSYAELGLAVSAEEFLINNVGAIIVTALLILIIVIIFICTYTYGNFLMMNVYKSYLTGEQLSYTKNLYFSMKHFRAYMGVLGWMFLYILGPIVLGIILIIPFGILAKGAIGLSTTLTAILSFGVFLALFIWLVVLVIRLAFSYYALLYGQEIAKAKTYTDESFRLTKGKVWKILFLVLPFLLCIGIVASIAQTIQEKITEGRVYQALREVQKQSGQDDHQLLEGFFVGSESSKGDFKKVETAFSPIKTDINKDFLSASMIYIDPSVVDKNGWIFTSIFILFSFLVLEGLPSMIYLSVYHILVNKDRENGWDASLK